MPKTAYLRVRNWDVWQTYRKDRGQPPWIKVYRSLLTDYEFSCLSDADKGHVLCLWLLAAERNGRIPYDANALKRMCLLEKEPDLEKLLSLQILEKEGKRRRQRDNHKNEVAPPRDRVDIPPLTPPTAQGGDVRKKRTNGRPPKWSSRSDAAVLAAAGVLGVPTRGKSKPELFDRLTDAWNGATPEARQSVAEALQ